MQNGIPLTAEQQLALVEQYGGLDVWGTELTAPHYAAAWAWAGNCPFQWGKQMASHLGGSRNPMAVSWPARITEKGGLRSQFTHVIDVGPTILEVAGIPAPTHVNGIEQQPFHGTSFLGSLTDANAAEHRTQQYFEVMGYRAMYKDGWWLSMVPPRIPVGSDPRRNGQAGTGCVEPRRRPGRALLPAGRLHPGQRPGRQQPRQGGRAAPVVLGGGRAVSGPAPARGPVGAVRHRPAAGDADPFHLPRRRAEHRLRDDPEGLRPLLHHHRPPGDPRRAAPRGSSSPRPTISAAFRSSSRTASCDTPTR